MRCALEQAPARRLERQVEQLRKRLTSRPGAARIYVRT